MAGDENWQIGKHKLPRSIVIDINKCIESQKCVLQTNGTISVPLLAVVLETPYITADAPPLTNGQIKFKVRFRYNAGDVYSHHYIDTAHRDGSHRDGQCH